MVWTQEEPQNQGAWLSIQDALRGCLQLLWKSLDAEHDFKRKLGISREDFMNGIFQSLHGGAGEEPSKEVQR